MVVRVRLLDGVCYCAIGSACVVVCGLKCVCYNVIVRVCVLE